jgi:hypothetical protein
MYVAHSFAIFLPLDVGDDLNVEHGFVEFSLIIIVAHDFFSAGGKTHVGANYYNSWEK